MAEYYIILIIYIILEIIFYHTFFVTSSIDGHLVCFYDLAIVNSAAGNIAVQILFCCV